MYYWTEQDNAELIIYQQAKTLRQVGQQLAKLHKAWPDKYPKGMTITVCKRSKNYDERMVWHGDYTFTGDTLKAERKGNPLLEQLGLR